MEANQHNPNFPYGDFSMLPYHEEFDPNMNQDLWCSEFSEQDWIVGAGPGSAIENVGILANDTPTLLSNIYFFELGYDIVHRYLKALREGPTNDSFASSMNAESNFSPSFIEIQDETSESKVQELYHLRKQVKTLKASSQKLKNDLDAALLNLSVVEESYVTFMNEYLMHKEQIVQETAQISEEWRKLALAKRENESLGEKFCR